MNDVAVMAKNNDCMPPGSLAILSLNSLHLYHIGLFSDSSHLSKYLLAWTVNVLNAKNSALVSESLQALYHTQGDWTNNEVVQVVQMVSFNCAKSNF